MTLREHALQEFDILMNYDSDKDTNSEKEFWDMMKADVMELIETFAKQGHSGGSAGYCISLFEKLARYETLSPITGEDHEWVEVSEDYENQRLFQNRRAGEVFKTIDRDTGETECYQIDYYIFREPDGCCFTSRDSRKQITEWPYEPSREYIDVPKQEEV